MRHANLREMVGQPRLASHIDRLYAWKHGQVFPPVVVDVTPVAACNQKCTHCFSFEKMRSAPPAQRKLDTPTLVRLFGEAAAAGANLMFIEGLGEPLLHEGLPQAVAAGAQAGIDSMVVTNGVLLAPEIQEQLLPHLWAIRFSVLTSDAARYARLHGCDESQWHTLVANIEHMVRLREQRNLPVILWCTCYLFPETADSFYEDIRFVRELGFDLVNVGQMDESPFGREPNRGQMIHVGMVPGGEARLKSLESESFCVNLRLRGTPSRDQCYVLRETRVEQGCQGVLFKTCVASDGRVYPCHPYMYRPEYSYGDLHTQSFGEIWAGKRRLEIVEQVNREGYDPDRCFCFQNYINVELLRLSNPSKFTNMV